jgi:hypothetical protein
MGATRQPNVIYWQPIETAPKDGREIVLSTDDGVVWIAKWSARTQTWDDGDFRDDIQGARFWMNIPELPND